MINLIIHFILFYVNTQDVGKLKYENSGQASKNLISSENASQIARNAISSFKSATGAATASFMSGSTKAQQLNPRRSANKPTKIFTHTRAPTTRTDMVIALYMPAQVEVTYNSAYEDKEIGMIAKGISNVMGAENKVQSHGEYNCSIHLKMIQKSLLILLSSDSKSLDKN